MLGCEMELRPRETLRMTPREFWLASRGYARREGRRSEEMALHVVNLLNLQGKYLKREMTLRNYLGRDPAFILARQRQLGDMTDGERQHWREERRKARAEKQREQGVAPNATGTTPGPAETP